MLTNPSKSECLNILKGFLVDLWLVNHDVLGASFDDIIRGVFGDRIKAAFYIFVLAVNLNQPKICRIRI
jgi:hypothetical protein